MEYKLPIHKSKIFAYVEAFPKNKEEIIKFKKNNFLYDDPRIWNLQSEYLDPLINKLTDLM